MDEALSFPPLLEDSSDSESVAKDGGGDQGMKITNITMLKHGRPRLTHQALCTLDENTPKDHYTLTTFDDQGKMGTGGARNEVIKRSQERFGQGEYLYLSDNDVAFTPGWLEIMIAVYKHARKYLSVGALGGYCHPYHQPHEKYLWSESPFREIGITWALPTQSMLMSWEIWERFGPFVETPPGKIRQSEDWNFTERLRAAGLRVGAIYRPVVLPTGRHDTFGELVPEHEFIKDIPGLLVE